MLLHWFVGTFLPYSWNVKILTMTVGCIGQIPAPKGSNFFPGDRQNSTIWAVWLWKLRLESLQSLNSAPASDLGSPPCLAELWHFKTKLEPAWFSFNFSKCKQPELHMCMRLVLCAEADPRPYCFLGISDLIFQSTTRHCMWAVLTMQVTYFKSGVHSKLQVYVFLWYG